MIDGDTSKPAVTCSNVTKYFYKDGARLTAVEDVSLEFQKATFTSLIGPSGCGKSTILNMMAGLIEPDIGNVAYGDKRLKGLAVGIGYMTQHETLLPWRTVEENVRLPLEINKRDLKAESSRSRGSDAEVDAVLRLVHLDGFKNHRPREISGGMRKRTSLAQALIYAQETILMDEPFGALDSQTRLELQRQLSRIWEHEERTVILVTHDIEEAISLSDRIVVLQNNPGKVKAIVDVDIPRPRDAVRVRFEPRFQELFRHVWTLMHPEEEGQDTSAMTSRN